MTVRTYLLVTVSAALGSIVPMLHDIAPRLAWNASASAPIGLYRIHPGRKPRVGEMVLIKLPAPLATWMARRHYLPVGVPLLKHVGALPGQTVCRSGMNIWINGKQQVRALGHDRRGRPLPVWDGCMTIAQDKIFVLNSAAPDSFDSRYFGPIASSGIIGTATPLLTRNGITGAFVWRGGKP
jgi:conjugative transfer signal peptidase TraF